MLTPDDIVLLRKDKVLSIVADESALLVHQVLPFIIFVGAVRLLEEHAIFCTELGEPMPIDHLLRPVAEGAQVLPALDAYKIRNRLEEIFNITKTHKVASHHQRMWRLFCHTLCKGVDRDANALHPFNDDAHIWSDIRRNVGLEIDVAACSASLQGEERIIRCQGTLQGLAGQLGVDGKRACAGPYTEDISLESAYTPIPVSGCWQLIIRNNVIGIFFTAGETQGDRALEIRRLPIFQIVLRHHG